MTSRQVAHCSLVVGVLLAAHPRPTTAQDTRDDKDKASMGAVTRAYEEAFNKRDAAAVGKLWTEAGVHVDRATGVKTRGRDAIVRDLETAFKEIPEAKLSVEAGEVRMVTPTVAQAEGTVTTLIPGEEPAVIEFSALLVKQGDAWLLDSVEESPVPQPETANDALQQLAWMVGDWADQTEGIATTSSFAWSRGGNFLVRRFSTQFGEEEEMSGTQIIGWDPRSHEIRSWTFNADGSFGEAIWSKNGGDWLVKSTQTLADAGVASGTYVITPVDDNSMKIGLVGHEVNGEPVPRVAAVTVVRTAAPSAEAATSEEGK
ncbi:SnoaL-like domain protein [Caulifigura coniformis]|uniref:SnoaL-like domain protein n=1 Tax=Caulifigura coniformis TaxID=2527983 RepID=A0A517SM31_9PLAN|nr:SgcJ/EcaC family oxidoreductase [Caulifigura coniformis]QDT57189.1 SnoaL-like domain protein [Caulifigura coniformis]